MTICVFGAASANIDKKYIEQTEELGKEIARRKHSLVFGGGGTGVMGAVARGVHAEGGFVHGVVPYFFREEGVEILYDEANKLTYTGDMATRKKIMEDCADAFIIAPGGVGTLEEFFEVLILKKLSKHNKPIVFFNLDGHYDGIEEFMQTIIKNKFANESDKKLYTFATDVKEILDIIEREL